MATETFIRLETLSPSARDLKESTGWDDWLVDDYLTFFNNAVVLSQALDSETALNDEEILKINEQLAGLTATAGRLQANAANLSKGQLNNAQLIAGLEASLSVNVALVSAIAAAQKNLQQLTSGVTTSYLLGIIKKQDQRISKLEQQVV